MDQKQITVLDGSKEKREKIMKEFFGLRPDQSFQEIETDAEDDEDV